MFKWNPTRINGNPEEKYNLPTNPIVYFIPKTTSVITYGIFQNREFMPYFSTNDNIYKPDEIGYWSYPSSSACEWHFKRCMYTCTQQGENNWCMFIRQAIESKVLEYIRAPDGIIDGWIHKDQ